MQTPTTAQLRAAIEVLKKLGERVNIQAAHSVTQLPDTRLGDDHAARIGARSIDQTSRIESVAAQLQSWREELRQQRRQGVSRHV
jgi:hypothetical protein